ncbi:hypothetical protein LIPSTDRAFT_260711 [Lipomyces starkeyi NRRL Y-11557]|uniref:Uncharacterized protein n=1 Tax=Lipomyces starkeyi NRRL Y-11557 TaxID=675824 RepID=A0A1E3Q6Y8_LIPST|nr:hypothetical protein LIPSTDRAFT_260711 [Lipomyces starkeyi NRRL Y-11557]
MFICNVMTKLLRDICRDTREEGVDVMNTFVDSMEFVGRLLNDLIDGPPNWQVISSSIYTTLVSDISCSLRYLLSSPISPILSDISYPLYIKSFLMSISKKPFSSTEVDQRSVIYLRKRRSWRRIKGRRRQSAIR